MDFLRRHRRRLRLLLAGLLLPLLGFVALAAGMRVDAPFNLDEPGLRLVHAVAGPLLDRTFHLIANVGFAFGVIPFGIVFVLVLAVRRCWREASFALLALGGSIAINVELPELFARPRPELWESDAFRDGFGFPSGHAMATMTLAWVLALLFWRTRWRWPIVIGMSAFTLLVGVSRLYLGVHYPSDVVAGWAIASAWAVCSFLLLFGPHGHAWGQARVMQRSDG